ncbi:MAG: hypothetical protein ABUL53_13510, partial [Bradyrhizobium guangdongense]
MIRTENCGTTGLEKFFVRPLEIICRFFKSFFAARAVCRAPASGPARAPDRASDIAVNTVLRSFVSILLF